MDELFLGQRDYAPASGQRAIRPRASAGKHVEDGFSHRGRNGARHPFRRGCRILAHRRHQARCAQGALVPFPPTRTGRSPGPSRYARGRRHRVHHARRDQARRRTVNPQAPPRLAQRAFPDGIQRPAAHPHGAVSQRPHERRERAHRQGTRSFPSPRRRFSAPSHGGLRTMVQRGRKHRTLAESGSRT